MAFSNYTGSKSKDYNLCKLVVKKLGLDNISEPLRNELIQVNGELTEATVQFFKYQLIVDCVKKFLDQNVKRTTINKEHGILSNPFYLTYAKKYSSADSIQAFGIAEDFIDKTIRRLQKTQVEKEEFNKFVENEVDNFCVKISEYAGYAQRYKSNKRRAFQEAVKELRTQFDNLTDAKFKLESEEKEMNDLLSTYFENLTEGVSMLKSLVSLHEETIKFQSSLGKLYESRHSTLAAKINRFEHQILVATYHEKSVRALTKIREELDHKKVIIDNDLNNTNSELQTYSVLGPQYEKLVDEYSELLRKILHQKWTIESLKKRQSFGGSLSEKEELDLVNSFEFDKETGCSRLVNISGYSMLEETSSCSVLVETANNSTLVETADDSRLSETANNSTYDDVFSNSKFDETSENLKFDETFENSKFDETFENSKLVETSDNLKLDETSEI